MGGVQSDLLKAGQRFGAGKGKDHNQANIGRATDGADLEYCHAPCCGRNASEETWMTLYKQRRAKRSRAHRLSLKQFHNHIIPHAVDAMQVKRHR